MLLFILNLFNYCASDTLFYGATPGWLEVIGEKNTLIHITIYSIEGTKIIDKRTIKMDKQHISINISLNTWHSFILKSSKPIAIFATTIAADNTSDDDVYSLFGKDLNLYIPSYRFVDGKHIGNLFISSEHPTNVYFNNKKISLYGIKPFKIYPTDSNGASVHIHALNNISCIAGLSDDNVLTEIKGEANKKFLFPAFAGSYWGKNKKGKGIVTIQAFDSLTHITYIYNKDTITRLLEPWQFLKISTTAKTVFNWAEWSIFKIQSTQPVSVIMQDFYEPDTFFSFGTTDITPYAKNSYVLNTSMSDRIIILSPQSNIINLNNEQFSINSMQVMIIPVKKFSTMFITGKNPFIVYLSGHFFDESFFNIFSWEHYTGKTNQMPFEKIMPQHGEKNGKYFLTSTLLNKSTLFINTIPYMLYDTLYLFKKYKGTLNYLLKDAHGNILLSDSINFNSQQILLPPVSLMSDGKFYINYIFNMDTLIIPIYIKEITME